MANFDFSRIAQWASETQIVVAEETAKIARNVFYKVVYNSPYRTGMFIGNWQIAPTKNTTATLNKETQAQKIAEINSVITDDYFLMHDTVVMFNNVDYAHNVEYDGWKRTGPYAPVATTMASVNAEFGGGKV